MVVAYLVTKARSTAGFNALISSKLDQWPPLIGTLVVVDSLALCQYGSLPFDAKQAGEIRRTAAQSFFALALLGDFEFSAREAVAPLALFCSQVSVAFLPVRDAVALPLANHEFLLAFGAVYLVAAGWPLAAQLEDLRALLRRTARATGDAWGRGPSEPGTTDD